MNKHLALKGPICTHGCFKILLCYYENLGNYGETRIMFELSAFILCYEL